MAEPTGRQWAKEPSNTEINQPPKAQGKSVWNMDLGEKLRRARILSQQLILPSPQSPEISTCDQTWHPQRDKQNKDQQTTQNQRFKERAARGHHKEEIIPRETEFIEHIEED